MDRVEVLERRLSRERAARKQAEALRESKCRELYTANEALKAGYDALEARVAERTAELEASRDAARSASRAKSEFLSNMSHEIRTPMNGALGMADLPSATSLDARQRRYVNTISSSGAALLAIVNDILDFSKIETALRNLA